MKLSVNVVTGGQYVRAGDPLPSDFVLPPHLEAFVMTSHRRLRGPIAAFL